MNANKLLNSKIAITLSKCGDKANDRLLPKTIPCPKRNIAISARILDDHSIHALPLSKGNPPSFDKYIIYYHSIFVNIKSYLLNK